MYSVIFSAVFSSRYTSLAFPFLNNCNVGYALTRYLEQIDSFSVQSNLANIKGSDANKEAACSYSGSSALQWWHDGAKKSTNTRSCWLMFFMNSSWFFKWTTCPVTVKIQVEMSQMLCHFIFWHVKRKEKKKKCLRLFMLLFILDWTKGPGWCD